MASYDKDLGRRIGDVLKGKGIETPMTVIRTGDTMSPKECIELSQYRIMAALGLDATDDSLHDTPKRVAKMYCDEVFYGLNYDLFPKCTTVENKMGHNELVIVKGSEVLSMCEHHFVPFIGTCSIGYIPTTKVMGLSKFPRIVDFFSRRPQIQERLTEQVYATLSDILETDDIAVVMEAQHMCMRLRGVKVDGATTITSKMGGRFMSKPELREEFLMLTRK